MSERTVEKADEAGPAQSAVRAVGVGPGAPEYLTGRARAAVESADVVVGFETVVDVIRPIAEGAVLSCGYDDEGETLAAFTDRVEAGAEGVAVLMGDPNVSGYQFLEKVERALGERVWIVPGISSIQMAASRARTPLDHSTVVSLHRRGPLEGELDRLVAEAGERHLLVLPRPYDWMPEAISRHLLEGGAEGSLEALVCERLSHEAETITRTTVGELAAGRTDATGTAGPEDSRFSDLSVMVVPAPDTTRISESGTEREP